MSKRLLAYGMIFLALVNESSAQSGSRGKAPPDHPVLLPSFAKSESVKVLIRDSDPKLGAANKISALFSHPVVEGDWLAFRTYDGTQATGIWALNLQNGELGKRVDLTT